jgi:maleamate amidohydrolase
MPHLAKDALLTKPRELGSLGTAQANAHSRKNQMASLEQFEDHCWNDIMPAADLKLYSCYARTTHVGPRPALLAIDLYNLVYRGGPHSPYELDPAYPNSCGYFAHRAIEPTKRLFAAARKAAVPIFYCTQETRPNNRPQRAVSTRRQNMALPSENDDYGIYHEFTPQATDIVIRKQRASVFNGTPIVSHLTTLGVNSLIICGESTSGCVRASSVDAYSFGFHVSLVEECTFDRSELIHKVNLFDLHHKYVDVMHVDEVIAHLNGLASARSDPMSAVRPARLATA